MKVEAVDILRQIVRCDREAPDFGMCDARDHNGRWYPSADLSAWLNEARKLLAKVDR